MGRAGRSAGRLGEVQSTVWMFRKASKSAERFSECRVQEVKRQEGRSAGKSAGRKAACGWQRGLAGCRTGKEAVNKAAQAPLVPWDGGQGHGLGFPQDRDRPKTAPNRKKGLGIAGQSPSLIHCGKERERQTRKETGRDKGIGRTDRRKQGQGLVKLLLSTLPLLPFLSLTPTHRLS